MNKSIVQHTLYFTWTIMYHCLKDHINLKNLMFKRTKTASTLSCGGLCNKENKNRLCCLPPLEFLFYKKKRLKILKLPCENQGCFKNCYDYKASCIFLVLLDNNLHIDIGSALCSRNKIISRT